MGAVLSHSSLICCAVNIVPKLSWIGGCKGNPNSLDEQLLTQDLARGNPKRMFKDPWLDQTTNDILRITVPSPPSTKPPINRCPCDSGGCCSVMWTCPNMSDAHPMLLRYKQRKEWEVKDFW
jgi:hypothetical protein